MQPVSPADCNLPQPILRRASCTTSQFKYVFAPLNQSRGYVGYTNREQVFSLGINNKRPMDSWHWLTHPCLQQVPCVGSCIGSRGTILNLWAALKCNGLQTPVLATVQVIRYFLFWHCRMSQHASAASSACGAQARLSALSRRMAARASLRSGSTRRTSYRYVCWHAVASHKSSVVALCMMGSIAFGRLNL